MLTTWLIARVQTKARSSLTVSHFFRGLQRAELQSCAQTETGDKKSTMYSRKLDLLPYTIKLSRPVAATGIPSKVKILPSGGQADFPTMKTNSLLSLRCHDEDDGIKLNEELW